MAALQPVLAVVAWPWFLLRLTVGGLLESLGPGDPAARSRRGFLVDRSSAACPPSPGSSPCSSARSPRTTAILSALPRSTPDSSGSSIIPPSSRSSVRRLVHLAGRPTPRNRTAPRSPPGRSSPSKSACPSAPPSRKPAPGSASRTGHPRQPRGYPTLIVSFGYDVTNLKRSDEGEHSARFKVVLDSGRDPVGTEDRVLRRLRAPSTRSSRRRCAHHPPGALQHPRTAGGRDRGR
jgi:hypothetical protein